MKLKNLFLIFLISLQSVKMIPIVKLMNIAMMDIAVMVSVQSFLQLILSLN